MKMLKRIERNKAKGKHGEVVGDNDVRLVKNVGHDRAWVGSGSGGDGGPCDLGGSMECLE